MSPWNSDDLEQGLGPPDVARLSNAQLHQPCDAVLHYLASPASFIERRTGLQLARLLQQGFLRVDLHRSPALTSRALSPQGARRTGLDGKDEHPTATLGWSQVTTQLLGWAGTRSSLEIDLKGGLGEQLVVVDLRHLGDYRPSRGRKFGARAASAIGAVAKHLHHLAASGRFARLDHLQRVVRVGCITRQDVNGRDQLRVGVHADLCLVANAAMAALAGRLFGAVERLRETCGYPLPPSFRDLHEQSVMAVRSRLGAAAFSAAWAAGRAASLDEIMAEALDEDECSTSQETERAAAAGVSDPLSRREREVAALIAGGGPIARSQESS